VVGGFVYAIIISLLVNQIRKDEPDYSSFQVVIQGTRDANLQLTRMSLVGPEGTTVMDSLAGVGTWSESPTDEGLVEVELESDETDVPLEPGVYEIRLEIAGADSEGLWFVLHDQVASSTPVVGAPLAGAQVQSRNPTVSWDDPVRPEDRAYESTSVFVMVLDLASYPHADSAWSLWTSSPLRMTVLGSDAGQGVTALDDGNYWLSVTYGRHRRFGPITIGRLGRTALPFQVAVP
jgi:hypothetical protein